MILMKDPFMYHTWSYDVFSGILVVFPREGRKECSASLPRAGFRCILGNAFMHHWFMNFLLAGIFHRAVLFHWTVEFVITLWMLNWIGLWNLDLIFLLTFDFFIINTNVCHEFRKKSTNDVSQSFFLYYFLEYESQIEFTNG